jgi:uncharacterized protein (TIGR03790 family)
LILAACMAMNVAGAQGLTAARLGVIYNTDDPASHRLALYYAAARGVPLVNVVGVALPAVDVLAPELFEPIRKRALEELPTTVQALLLVWSKPYAVGCMSVTTAFAAGYRAGFCEPGCSPTLVSPLFDSAGWLPVDTVDWYPAMLLPIADEGLAREVIQRGVRADYSAPPGILYLVRTSDPKRNVRASTYADVALSMGKRLQVVQMSTPMPMQIPDAIGYFTGATRVVELPRIQFRAGALADHLTSVGGVLDGTDQMSIVEWLKQGATASYGTVSEPCSILEKFPNVDVLFEHYRHGETVLESYWKSVAMPGQGIFIGEPLARPYAERGH